MTRMRWFLLIAAVFLLIAAFLYALLRFFLPGPAASVVLPTPRPAAPSPGLINMPAEPGTLPLPIKADTENIRTLLATLTRPAEYTAEWSLTYIWPYGEATVKRRVYVRNGYSMTEWLDERNRVTKYVLTGRDWSFWWKPGDTVSHTGAGSDADGQNHLAAYEPLTGIDPGAITDAGYSTDNEIPILWAATDDPELGLTATYRISLDTGLLLQADLESSQGGCYMLLLSHELSPPGDEHFRLPEGRLAWESEG